MGKITVHVPDVLSSHEGDIRYFFDSMVRKLAVNSHKGWVNGSDVDLMLEFLSQECQELLDARKSESQFQAIMEAVDVSNMALLCGMAISKQTRKEFDEGKKK